MQRPSEGEDNNQLNQTKTDVLTGTAVLICAQLAAASTASCVKALPIETPSMLRGLWRQTLTTFIFSVFTIIKWLHSRHGRHNRKESEVDAHQGEKTNLLPKSSVRERNNQERTKNAISGAHVGLVALTVIGATLLNDTIVVALQYASSAAVMCLCNTTPIWLILYAVIDCRVEAPGSFTMVGAALSLFGTVVCSTGEGDEDSEYQHGRLGAIIAMIGAIGGAIYMVACRKLSPCGLHPIHLSLIINIGMMITTFLLCLSTLPNGIVFFSTDLSSGFFGFLNPKANPAAVLHSIFPDLGGNFGIMLALHYFEPLIVSMVMLTEPLNASIIAMYAVHEAPPSRQTVIGVVIVLVGCAIVLWESSKDANDEKCESKERSDTLDTVALEAEEGYGATHVRVAEQIKHRGYQRRRSSAVLYSQLGKLAPDVIAYVDCRRPVGRRLSSAEDYIRDSQRISGQQPKRYESM